MNVYAYPVDPVSGGDPWGVKIIFAAGSTKAQIKEYKKAVAYLKNSPTAAGIDQLEVSTTDYTINFWNDKDGACDVKGNIYWNPRLSLTCTGDNAEGSLSPSLALLHEMDHCANYDLVLYGTEDKDYDNGEERRVISGSEKAVASELNKKLKTREGKIFNHSGTETIVPSLTNVILK